MEFPEKERWGALQNKEQPRKIATKKLKFDLLDGLRMCRGGL